jgi:hypothetical protein
MKFKQITLIFPLIFCTALNINAQNLTSDSSAYAKAIGFYEMTVGDVSSLYTGRQYLGYDFRIEGHQFLDVKESMKGSLLYDNILYNNVKIQYELVKDDLIINYADNDFRIIIKKQDLQWFKVQDRLFVNLETPQLSGIYELVEIGALEVLIKRTKIVAEEIRDRTLRRKFVQKNRHYIKKGEDLYPVTSKKRLLNYFKDEKKGIRKMLKKNKLTYKKGPEQSIIKTVEYIEALSK